MTDDLIKRLEYRKTVTTGYKQTEDVLRNPDGPEAAARIRELEAAQEVAVKPLRWEDARFSDYPREIADSLIGTYEVLQWASGGYGGSVPADDPDQSGTEFSGASSMQEAKAAAQADYERRIRSALRALSGETPPCP